MTYDLPLAYLLKDLTGDRPAAIRTGAVSRYGATHVVVWYDPEWVYARQSPRPRVARPGSVERTFPLVEGPTR